MINSAYVVPPEVRRFQQRSLIVGAIFLLILAVGLFLDRTQFFRSYLFAFAFWLGIAVGSLALLMLLSWSASAQRVAIRVACLATVPICGLTVYFTYSRAGAVGSGIAVLVVLILSGRRFCYRRFIRDFLFSWCGLGW